MKPVVLIKRNWQGSAFQYHRYIDKECTDAVELEEVEVGKELPTLDSFDVEKFRTDPKKLG